MMKHLRFVFLAWVMQTGAAAAFAQAIITSSDEIRQFETRLDSMAQVGLSTLKKTPRDLISQNRYRAITVVSRSRTGMAEEKIVVRGRFKAKKKHAQVRHRQVIHRNLNQVKKNDLKLIIWRVNGEIVHAKAKDQLSQTLWVYHSSGYLKKKQPGLRKVWYTEKPIR